MSTELDRVVSEVSEATTVQASAAALISSIATRLKTAIDQLAAQSIDNTVLNQLATDLDTSSNDLAAAVAANTVAEEEVIEEEETDEDPLG